MVALDALPTATLPVGAAVNAQGQIAGWFSTANGCDHAFLWTPDTPGASAGTMIDLAACAQAYAINDQGQVAGWATAPKDRSQTAVLWSTANNTVTSTLFLGKLNGTRISLARGISNKVNGVVQVAGFSRSSSLAERATLWTVTQ